MTNFTELKKRIEVLEKLDEQLQSMEKDAGYDYEVIKETPTDEQDKNWRGELLWEDEDHTIPKMRVEREWGYVAKAELDEDDKMTLKVIADIRKALLKMV